MKFAMRTLYEILGVTPHATPAELKAAWRRAAMKWHPDRNRGGEHYAQAEFQRVNDAYAALTHPLRRAEYDFALHAGVRRLAPQPHHARHRRAYRAWREWLRRLQRNARALPQARQAAQRLPRSHWIAGLGAAIAAAVLIADFSVDETSLRSNFVSRQHSPYEAGAPAASGTSHRSTRAPGVRQAPPTAARPADDAGTGEMHAALARLRALARTADDNTHAMRDADAASGDAAAAPNAASSPPSDPPARRLRRLGAPT